MVWNRVVTSYESYRWPNNMQGAYSTRRSASGSSASMQRTLLRSKFEASRTDRYESKRTLNHIFTVILASVHLSPYALRYDFKLPTTTLGGCHSDDARSLLSNTVTRCLNRTETLRWGQLTVDVARAGIVDTCLSGRGG